MTAGRKSTSLSQHWNTPPKYVDLLVRFFGSIDLDPCSNEFSLVPARVRYSLPENDGLASSWAFASIYVNPPYGRGEGSSIKDWLQKCVAAYSAGSEIIALIPVATNTRHWKECVFPYAEGICFLADTRLKFYLNGKPSEKGSPMACALVYWGQFFSRFFSVFSEFGFTFQLRRDE